MSEILDNSVQCVVTSPPYWGLRKYSGEQELIWGDNHCEHEWDKRIFKQHSGRGDAQKSGKYSTQKPIPDMVLSDHICSLYGAWRGAYGLEPTPEMYIQHTIEILREIKRVLRKDGVIFWNIGDCYVSQPTGSLGGIFANRPSKIACFEEKKYTKQHPKNYGKLKPKDLCLIPFRVAIAAQEDKWWVRSVIIWSKPNPMPESVTDRPTESHEYILMLAKSAKYYWDADAVREPYSEIERWGGPVMKPSSNHKWSGDASDRVRLVQPKKPQAWEYADQTGGTLKNIKGDFSERGVTRTTEGLNLKTADEKMHPFGRNIRTVWEFPTQPYPEAHFAVFPEKLPELCIKASTPEVGCCSKCGKPWERITETTREYRRKKDYKSKMASGKEYDGRFYPDMYSNKVETIGWQPTCKCNADKVPSLVLDPFAGAGTTLKVAAELNRCAVGYEISEEYCQLSVERNRQQVLI